MGFMDELSKAVDTILKETEGKSMEELTDLFFLEEEIV